MEKPAWPYVQRFRSVQQVFVFVGVLICVRFAAMGFKVPVWLMLECVLAVGYAGLPVSDSSPPTL